MDKEARLRELLAAESTGRTDTAEPDYYALVKTAVARLQTAGSEQELCGLVVDEIRKITGHDRIMVHKFHPDGHGEVMAESRRADLGPWLGLHYPAQDIRRPARDVFTKTWIRPVPQVSGALAELVPLVNPDNGLSLNMTCCALRGASITYTEYLKIMSVAAAPTTATRTNENLRGLIACHHHAGPRHVSYQVRAACEFLAQVVTLQHQAAEIKEHANYRNTIEHVHRQLIDADNGIGIDPRHFGQVFKLFKRLHGRDEYGGGAGPTVVRKLAGRHQGKIWLDLTPGQGTTVDFTLPSGDLH